MRHSSIGYSSCHLQNQSLIGLTVTSWKKSLPQCQTTTDATGLQVPPWIQMGALTNHPGQDMCFYRPAKSKPAKPSTDKHTSTNSPLPRLAHTMAACSLGPGGKSCSASCGIRIWLQEMHTVSAASPSSLHLTTRVHYQSSFHLISERCSGLLQLSCHWGILIWF